MREQPLFVLPLKLATNPGGSGDQPAFPSVVDSSGLPHGEDIVANFFGTSESVKAQGKEFLMRINTHDELVAAASKAQCDCSPKERLSGHKIDCWFPELQEALAKTQPKEI